MSDDATKIAEALSAVNWPLIGLFAIAAFWFYIFGWLLGFKKGLVAFSSTRNSDRKKGVTT